MQGHGISMSRLKNFIVSRRSISILEEILDCRLTRQIAESAIWIAEAKNPAQSI